MVSTVKKRSLRNRDFGPRSHFRNIPGDDIARFLFSCKVKLHAMGLEPEEWPELGPQRPHGAADPTVLQHVFAEKPNLATRASKGVEKLAKLGRSQRAAKTPSKQPELGSQRSHRVLDPTILQHFSRRS